MRGYNPIEVTSTSEIVGVKNKSPRKALGDFYVVVDIGS